MRTTGIALLVMGALIGVFAAVSGGTVGDPGPGMTPTRDLNVPLVFAAAAVLLGTGMFFFGSRSYVATQNPAVRN